jgi:3-oxoacyl-[acyl-carrier protein] reductase
MDLMLKGRGVLVGGGSRGLGRAAARSLLLEGARVMIAARDPKGLETAASELEKETAFRPFVCSADLSVPSDRERLFEEARRRLGVVEILVANAGGPPSGSFLEHNRERWNLALELTVGMFSHLASLALPDMKQRGFGRIVQIVSIAGLEAIDGLILSNAARPAVLGLAKALAREVASFGILVNSICPGVFSTDRVKEITRQQAAQHGIGDDEALMRLAGDIPLGRLGRPEELGDLAAFLCSPRNTYMTGSVVVIDGGKTRRLI